MKMKWNWWKKDNSTYSTMYNKVVDEVDDLKKQLKEYDELVLEDWAED